MKIVRNDEVVVITGNHKGKTGKVRKVLRDSDRVIVEGVNVVKRHQKPSQLNPEGGIVEKEASLHVSNVALIDPESKKATRVRLEGEGTDKKRVSTKSGKQIKKNLV